MNSWYPRYCGDYIRDTGHLSMMQDGAYNRLLDHYYATGKPLPAIAEQLQRICRAVAPVEQEALQAVIQEFFHLEGNVYRNHRADKEIAKMNNISEIRREVALRRYNKQPAIAPAIAEQLQDQLHTQPQPQPQPHTTVTPTRREEREGLLGLFDKIRTCRPEYAKMREMDVVTLLNGNKDVDAVTRMVDNWCVEQTNASEPMGNPIASLRKRITALSAPSGNQRFDPWAHHLKDRTQEEPT